MRTKITTAQPVASLAAETGWTAFDEHGARTHQSHYTTPQALRVYKPGRSDGWPVVGKVTAFLGSTEPILGVAWRKQLGTAGVISLPVFVLDYAEALGCEWLYWRQDREPLEMRCIRIADFRQTGWRQQDGEVYIRLDSMEPVPWRQWRYAADEVRLTGGTTALTGQGQPQLQQSAQRGCD